MARVTVEDCVDKFRTASSWCCSRPSGRRRFRQGAPITVDRDNDKNPVVALREIADETVDRDDLREGFIHAMQKHVEVDEPEPEPKCR